MGEPSSAVQKMMAEKVTVKDLVGKVGEYPNLHTKLVLELAREINYAADPNYTATSWASQKAAMDYFNENGFILTLDRMMTLREARDQ